MRAGARIEARLARLAPHALAALRIMTALLFMQHGLSKLFGFPAHSPGGFRLASQIGAAGVLEAAGGALVLLGLQTRLVAFLLSGEMAIAYFRAHAPRGLYPILNGGEPAILFCFVFLYLVFAGGGAWSLDRRR